MKKRASWTTWNTIITTVLLSLLPFWDQQGKTVVSLYQTLTSATTGHEHSKEGFGGLWGRKLAENGYFGKLGKPWSLAGPPGSAATVWSNRQPVYTLQQQLTSVIQQQSINQSRFLQRVSIACYAERCISYDRFDRPTVWPSDRPTVRHSPVSCQNDSTYDHAVFTGG